MDSGPATTMVQELISQETNRNGRVIVVFETELASLVMHTAMTGHIINGIGLCLASGVRRHGTYYNRLHLE